MYKYWVNGSVLSPRAIMKITIAVLVLSTIVFAHRSKPPASLPPTVETTSGTLIGALDDKGHGTHFLMYLSLQDTYQIHSGLIQRNCRYNFYYLSPFDSLIVTLLALWPTASRSSSLGPPRHLHRRERSTQPPSALRASSSSFTLAKS